MVEEGHVQFRENDLYALPGDHRERCEEALEKPYGRTYKRRVSRYSPSEGRRMVVAEFGRTASQRQREEEQRRDYARQKDLFLKRLASGKRRPEQDQKVEALLNAWDGDREAYTSR